METSSNKNTRVLIIDVGSGSIGAALVLIPKDQKVKPTILRSIRQTFAIEVELQFTQYEKAIISTIERVATEIIKNDFGAPERIEVFLSSPWYAAQSRSIHTIKNIPTLCTEKLLLSLIEQDVKLFEEEKEKTFADFGGKIELMERYIQHTKLNGYTIKDPIGKKASQMDIIVYMSVAPIALISDITAALNHVVKKDILFHSSLYMESVFTSIMHPDPDTFLLMDFGAEITDIALVKEGATIQSATIPFGKNTIVREYMKESGSTAAETISLLDTYFSKHMTPEITLKTTALLAKVKEKIQNELYNALIYISKNYFLPPHMYIVSVTKSALLLKDLIESPQFTGKTLSGVPFNAILVVKDGLSQYVDTIENAYDPVFITETIFISANYHNPLMPKNILEDIKPLTSTGRVYEPEPQEKLVLDKDRPARKVPIVEIPSRKEVLTKRIVKEEDVVPPPPKATKVPVYHSPRRRGRFLLWLVSVLILVALFFGLSSMFTKATVTVVPKMLSVEFDDTFSAKRNPTPEDLPFSVIEVEGSDSVDIPASGNAPLSKAATGKVILYNEFSTAVQQLKIDTRLETKDGAIYKTKTATTIPGYTTVDGKIVPGQVEVDIYADKVGPDGNIKATDFTIFGFKGTPKAAKFYGRSKGDITGGADGTYNTITLEEYKKAAGTLNDSLKEKLIRQAESQLPSGYIYFSDTVFFTPDTDTAPVLESEEKNITVIENGKLAIVFFDQKKLIGYILSKKVPNYKNEPVVIPNAEVLQLALINKGSIDAKESQAISFTLTGTAKVEYIVDTVKLTKDLIGKPKNEADLKPIIDSYQDSIQKVFISIKPFWKMKLPTDESKISIVLQTDQP